MLANLYSYSTVCIMLNINIRSSQNSARETHSQVASVIVSYNPSELFKPVSSCSVSTAKNHMYLAKYNHKQRCACIMLLLVSVLVRKSDFVK